MAIVSSTIMERDQKGRVQLYCSSTCVEQSRPPQHVLTGETYERDTLTCCSQGKRVSLLINTLFFFFSFLFNVAILPQALHSPAASARCQPYLSTIWPWWTAPFVTSAPMTVFLYTGYNFLFPTNRVCYPVITTLFFFFFFY